MLGKKSIAVMALWGVLLGGASLAAGSNRQKAVEALNAKNYEKAIAILKKEAARGKENEQFWNLCRLGSAYYLSKQIPEAIATLEEALKHLGRASAADALETSVCYFYLGQAQNDSQRYQEAAASFSNGASFELRISRGQSDAGERAKNEQSAAGLLGWQGASLLWSGKYQDAADAFQKAIRLNPKRADIYMGLAAASVRIKQYDEALAAVRSAVELAGDSAESYSIRGDVYAAQNRHDEAVDAYRKAVERDPKTAAYATKLAMILLDKGDESGAFEALKTAEGLAREDPSVFYGLGLAYSRAGRFDEAVKLTGKGIDLITYVGIGLMIRSENGYPIVLKQAEGEAGLVEGPAKEAGLKAGDRLITIDGRPTKGWDANKIVQSLRGAESTSVVLKVERTGAAKPFDITVTRKRISPKAAAPYYGDRSLYAREAGDREAAARDAELAYSLDPDNEDARKAMAAVDVDRGRYAEAIKLLSPLKDDSFARILEATAFAKQGDFAQAAEIYASIPEEELSARRAVRQNAKKALLQTLQSYVQEKLDKAGAANSAGRFMEAMSEYAEAIKIADEVSAAAIRQKIAGLIKAHPYLAELPEEARQSALGGDAFIKDGGFADALKEYRKALGLAPFNPQLHFNAALIYAQLKDCRGAIKHMTIYLQLKPDAPNARAAKDEIGKWELIIEEREKR